MLARIAGPEWLLELMTCLCLMRPRPTVITTNYDTLVECAVTSARVWDKERNQYIRGHDALRGLPGLTRRHAIATAKATGPRWRHHDEVAYQPSKAVLQNELHDRRHARTMWTTRNPSLTFRLLKLHGSLDWCWTSGDTTGASIRMREGVDSYFGFPAVSRLAPSVALDGADPLIIPPTATKSGFYDNPLMRQLWREARAALELSDRITIVGYSLPQTDIVFSSMLIEAARHGAHQRRLRGLSPLVLRVVNPNAKVVQRFDRLFSKDWVILEKPPVRYPNPSSWLASTITEEMSREAAAAIAATPRYPSGQHEGREEAHVVVASGGVGGPVFHVTDVMTDRGTDGKAVVQLIPGNGRAGYRGMSLGALAKKIAGATGIVVATQELRVPIVRVRLATASEARAWRFDDSSPPALVLVPSSQFGFSRCRLTGRIAMSRGADILSSPLDRRCKC